MNGFHPFPHTPHIAWLAKGEPRDDKVLSVPEATAFLDGDIAIEEKVDGSNIGFSMDTDGGLLVQNRGQYLAAPYTGEFRKLADWLRRHEGSIFDSWEPDWILFGEWCAARHSVAYRALPDFFLAFDIYDSSQAKFMSTDRRDRIVAKIGLVCVPRIAYGRFELDGLIVRLSKEHSRNGDCPVEGFYLRRQNDEWMENRAKLVQQAFIESIGEHWSKRKIVWNETLR